MICSNSETVPRQKVLDIVMPLLGLVNVGKRPLTCAVYEMRRCRRMFKMDSASKRRIYAQYIRQTLLEDVKMNEEKEENSDIVWGREDIGI